MRLIPCLPATLLGLAIAAPALAADSEVYLTLEAEHREYPQESRAPGREDRSSSAAATVEWFTEWNRGDQVLSGKIFGRVDSVDDERTHADIRELSFVHAARAWEARLGIRKVFWGVTESRHLVDIINQTDFVEDIDGEDKLGQPMVNLAWIPRGWGSVDVFWLPYFRERTFPGEDGRPGFPLPIEEDEARYQSDDKQQHQDFALRWRHTVGPADFGIGWFDGTARAPRLVPCVRQGSGFAGTQNQANCDIASAAPQPASLTDVEALNDLITAIAVQSGLSPSDAQIRQQIFSNLVLVPFYDQIRQASIDAQLILGGWALKLEATRREQRQRWTNAMATGFEYTLYGVFDTAADVGLLSEYLYDQRDDPLVALFDRDLFAGTRITLNDVAGTTFLGGTLYDLDDESLAITVEAERRLTERFKAQIEARLFTNVPEGSPAEVFANEDFVSLILQAYF